MFSSIFFQTGEHIGWGVGLVSAFIMGMILGWKLANKRKKKK
ncbi:hypothetical protein [Mycoplasma suis]|nr:hypothetical protein [Mycoplasma suis]